MTSEPIGPGPGRAADAAPRPRALKRLGQPETPEQKKLLQAARDFESVMLSMVFKQMGQTNSGADPLGGGAANRTWKDMLADERARSMTASGGLGLADSIYQQLAQRV